MEFLIVLNDLGAVMCLQCSKGETQWAYPHARKDCLRLQKSEKKVDNVSNVTGIKILFLSSLLLLLLLLCIPFLLAPCARVYLNWFSVLMVCSQGGFPLPLVLRKVFVAKLVEYPLQPQLM